MFSLMKYKMSLNGKMYLRPSLSILTVIFILQVQILNYYLVNLQRILQDVMYTLTYIHLLSVKHKKFAIELGRNISNEDLFYEYMEFGGLPQCCSLIEKQSKQTYLEDIFNTIVINDIIEHNNISDIFLLKQIIVFLLDNIGNPFLQILFIKH